MKKRTGWHIAGKDRCCTWFKQPLFSFTSPKLTFGLWVFLGLSSAIHGGDKRDLSAEREEYKDQLENCRAKLRDIVKLPIIGGGYVDMSRFGFVGSNVRFEEGQCGVDLLELSFWWTGKEIIPDNIAFIKVKRADIPDSWRHFNVAAKLVNQKKARECRNNIELPQCAGLKSAVRRGWKYAEWPERLTVSLKNYPGLEFWLKEEPPSVENKYRVGNFVIVNWPRSDGTPRSIDCWGLDFDYARQLGLDKETLAGLSRGRIENIDFQGRLGRGVACQVEFWDFEFGGGAARVKFSTESLHEAPKALKALNKYITDSIVMED